MKILFYCQYIYGIGHLVRTVTIARELSREHDIVFLYGGPDPANMIPVKKASTVLLDPVQADDDFHKYSSLKNRKIEYADLVRRRTKKIINAIKIHKPDLFWIEAFPFGRRKFRAELLPAINILRNDFPKCLICSSIRDIIFTEKDDPDHEQRVVDDLHSYFDMLFIHSDPTVLPLDWSFSLASKIKCKVVYTGFVSRVNRHNVKKTIWSDNGDIIVNSGGSSIGQEIFMTSIRCHQKYFNTRKLQIYLNPKLDGFESKISQLGKLKNVFIHKFSWDYVNHLKSSAVSVSMGGYNSIVEAIYTRTPAIVVPYNKNREQLSRVLKLKHENNFKIIEMNNLNSDLLRDEIEKVIDCNPITPGIDMNGAKFIVDYLKKLS